MKLISFITLLATVRSQKIQEEQFSFAPQFQTPSSILFSSDSSIYMPSESHTPIPYYTLNNFNKLPFQFLPPTGTKTPIFSTQFPVFLSSALNSDTDDDDENEQDEMNNRRLVIMKSPSKNHLNHTSASRQGYDKREDKSNTRLPNIQPSFEKFDIKSPSYVSSTKSPIQNQPIRRMIITSELKRSDMGLDQIKGPSYQNAQFIQAPGVFVSSTTEPSIPIIRLSNEMDLDGSFSYEALGADQTHYVQHSRMENMGTEKEEQVVEGSYSYVGDDGRTYTVHYVADSNGYRATGDHLPVPPPIPEIIQRSIQYNLAEEARHPHSKLSWENENNEYEHREETKQRLFSIPPPRNLFTGKTPEAFSFGFSQGKNSQNNLATAANYQTPTKTSFEIAMDHAKSKLNATPISPQITFLAAQGARNPSLQPQSHLTKTTNIEKPSLPLLVNYEANMKEPEQEVNKALWRWQYGLNTNTNQSPNKNSISRSSSEDDDIVINFSDMTPEQYTRLIQSQGLGKNIEESNNIDINNGQSSTPNNLNMHVTNNNLKVQEIDSTTETSKFIESSDNYDFYFKKADRKPNTNLYSKIISSHDFIPQSQVATQSYNIEITTFEPTQINGIDDNYNSYLNHNALYKVGHSNNAYILRDSSQEKTTSVEPMLDNVNSLKQSEFKLNDKDSFKPIVYNNNEESFKYESTTTETPIEEKIKENIFLKSLFNNDISNKNIHEESKQTNNISDTKVDKLPKYINFQKKPQSEIKIIQSKPLDISDVLNYVVMRNHFESVKTKPKSKPTNNIQNSHLKDTSAHYIPIKDANEDRESIRQEKDNNYQVLNNQYQQEIRGLLKNYKVLQRNKNTGLKSQPIPEPQRHIKAFHTQALPPLGRAGPSMKSYLPPTYL